MYKFDRIIVQMTTTVQISDFRKNISNYIDRMIADQGMINIKRGRVVVAKVVPRVKSKKINMAENILKDLESVRKKIGLKTKAKTMMELNREIDKMVYESSR